MNLLKRTKMLLNNDPESNRCLHCTPIKEDNLHVQYLINNAVLAIVRTANLIVKFDSSASFKIVPRLENFILATGLPLQS